MPRSSSFRSTRTVDVLLHRLHAVELPPSLRSGAQRLEALRPVLAAASRASSAAELARRAALAEVRRTSAALDAELPPLAIALVACGIGTLQQPFGPAGGTVSRVRRMRAIHKVEAVRVLVAIVRDHGCDDVLERVAAATTRLDEALVALGRADTAGRKATHERVEAASATHREAARLRSLARIELAADEGAYERLFDAGSATLRPSRRRKPRPTPTQPTQPPLPAPRAPAPTPGLAPGLHIEEAMRLSG